MLANHELLLAVGRTTLFTSAALTLVWLLNRSLRSTAPRFQRAAWTLAVAQAWLLIPYTFRVEVEEAAPTPVVMATNVVVSSAPLTIATPLLLEPEANTEWLTTSNLAKAIATIWIGGAAIAILLSVFRYVQFIRHLSSDAVRKTNVVISLREMEFCSRSEPPTLAHARPDEIEWQTEWQSQLAAATLKRRVALRMTDGLGPLVCFIPFYYLLLAPRELWQTLSHPERRVILQHELAHLERCDIWKSLLIRLLALPQWFNPLVWLAIRGFDEAGEWACDDRVAQKNRGSQLHLAKSLIQAAEFITAAAPATASAQGGVLSRRIRRLVTPQIQEGSNMKKGLLCATLVALAAVQIVRIERVSAAPQTIPPASFTEGAAVPAGVGYPENRWQGQQPYVIEPPDVLSITFNRAKFEPGADYLLRPLDSLEIGISIPPAKWKTRGYICDNDGYIDLQAPYGRVKVTGLTVEEATQTVRQFTKKSNEKVEATLRLAIPAAKQQVTEQYLVDWEGKVNLGAHGSVLVNGSTIEEARTKIDAVLSQYFEEPQVLVDLFACNSKRFYVVVKDKDMGDSVTAIPVTGNETVADAVATVGGIPKNKPVRLWVARPTGKKGEEQTLIVNWNEIADGKSTETNYQLLPGDRLYISPASTIALPQAPSNVLPTASRYSAADVPVVHGLARRDEPQPPAVVAQEREDGQMVPMQMVAAENGATVATAMSQVKRWLIPTELAKSPIVLRRPIKGGDLKEFEESRIVWDAEINSPTPETNYLLKPSDLILLLPRHAIVKNAETAEASPPIIVQLNGSRGQAVPAALMNDSKPVTVDRAICSVSWPHPMSFSKTTISVHRRNENGTETVLPVAWQGSMPTEETNHVLQAGDRVVVRDPNFVVASATSTVIQNTATIPPAPAANLPPGTTAVHCKAMLVRVKSGSLHEFEESQKKLKRGLDAATMETTLRVLQNNKLLEVLSRPECIAAVGEKARIEVGKQNTTDTPLRDGYLLEFFGQPSQNGIILQVNSTVFEGEKVHRFFKVAEIDAGKAILAKLFQEGKSPQVADDSATDRDQREIYLLVTPTVIRSGEKPPAAN